MGDHVQEVRPHRVFTLNHNEPVLISIYKAHISAKRQGTAGFLLLKLYCNALLNLRLQ